MTHSPTGSRTVAYVRASTIDTHSPEAQTAAILKWADQQGIYIKKWFKEAEGHNPRGTAHTRSQFQSLVAEIREGHWDVLVVASMDRIGRTDSLELARFLDLLGSKGCTLRIVDPDFTEDVAPDHVLDQTSTGRIIDVIHAEAAHQHAFGLAYRSLEGKLHAFLSGKPCGRKCPYGMARRIVDPLGQERHVGRHEQFATPKGWSQTLIPGDPQEVETVNRLFNAVATTGTGCRGLARQMNAEGVPAPDGGNWLGETVRRILTNPVYVGDSVFGRRRTGLFVSLRGGKVVEAGSGEIVQHHDTLHLQGTHQGIIDRATWDRVQAWLSRTANDRQHRDPLVGLLACGHCGHSLRRVQHSQSGSVSYGCLNADQHGPDCGVVHVGAMAILSAINEKLVGKAGTPDTIPDHIRSACSRVICYWKRRSLHIWELDRVEIEQLPQAGQNTNSQEGGQ